MRMVRTGMALLLCACRAIAADGPVAAPPQQLFLDVSVNGEPSGRIVGFRQNLRGLVVALDDLRQLGFDPRAFHADSQGEVELDGISGLAYRYDVARQAVAFDAADALRLPFQISTRGVLPVARATATPGAVWNYNAIVQLGKRPVAMVASDLRLFNERGAFSSSGVATIARERTSYLRYDTFWVESDPASLRSLQLGDTITSSLSWNRAIRIAGLQWSKSFALRPDLLTFPTPVIGGSALVPSALSLYVNGVQQFSTNVPGGPFVVNQVAGITGAGNAVVVTRDALGRATSTAVPLYVDTRMLAPGLSDFSLEAGLPRRGYGASSFGYQRTLAVSGSRRIGISEVLTLEAHGELAPGLVSAGVGALAAAGNAGVFNANVGASAGQRAGLQAGAGYQYVAPRFSIDAQVLRASPRYGDLAARDGSAVPRAVDHLALSVALAGTQSMSLSYVGFRNEQAPAARIAALGLTSSLPGGLFLSVSAFRDMARRGGRGAFASLSMAFGERTSANAVAGRQDGAAQRSASVVRAPANTGGAGWSLQDAQVGQVAYRAAQWQYLGRYGQVGAGLQGSGASTAATVEAAGALIVMDGSVAPVRRVGEGFALVSTDGLAGVPVLQENRLVGVTDASGHLLVPNLNVNGNNQLSIDTSGLAADVRVQGASRSVNPRRLSGVLAHFSIERYRAVNVVLHDASGLPLPVGLPVRHRESGKSGVVGYDGLVFVEETGDDNHLDVGEGAQRCTVQFTYSASAGDMLPLLGPLRCVAQGAAQ